MIKPKPKQVPVTVAKRIAEDYGHNQIIILILDENNEVFDTVSYRKEIFISEKIIAPPTLNSNLPTGIQNDATLEFWRMPKVLERTGLSESSIWRWVKTGDFPEPRRIGATALAWRSIDVLEWMDSRPAVPG